VQARVEVGVLQFLNTRGDPENRHHIVRMRDFFVFRNHLCLVFELLSVNLYELVKHNQFRGLSMNLLRVFINQVFDSPATIANDANNCILHDLYPQVQHVDYHFRIIVLHM
jgi:dual specificity protein kinase YAK1